MKLVSNPPVMGTAARHLEVLLEHVPIVHLVRALAVRDLRIDCRAGHMRIAGRVVAVPTSSV
ncbi:MAG: hypothetical protein H0W33_03615 [Gammaproteobacteria bacterium]|nr:hypothetical protein [Gammaproteobacteria bacterium]